MSKEELEGLSSAKLIERLMKAEAKIVDSKKTTKEEPAKESKEGILSKEELAEMINTAITADREAQVAAAAEVTAENNQDAANSASVAGDPSGKDGFVKKTAADFDSMSEKARGEYMTQSIEACDGNVEFASKEEA